MDMRGITNPAKKNPAEIQKCRTAILKEVSAHPEKNTPPLSLDALRVLIAIEKEKRKERGEPDFNCHAIESADLLIMVNYLLNLPVTEEGTRAQLLVASGSHCFGIDFLFSKKGNECFGLDAGGDVRGYKDFQKLTELKDREETPIFLKVYVANENDPRENIQRDLESCHIFSFDHLCQTSRMNIYQYFRDHTSLVLAHENLYSLRWKDLEPQLVWNATLIEWLKEYMKKNPDFVDKPLRSINITFKSLFDSNIEMTFKEFFESYIIPNMIQDPKKNNRDTNMTVKLLSDQYREEIASFLTRTSDEELIKILMPLPETLGKTSNQTKNFGPETKLNETVAILDKIKHLLNAKEFWQGRSTAPVALRELQRFYLNNNDRTDHSLEKDLINFTKRWVEKEKEKAFLGKNFEIYKLISMLDNPKERPAAEERITQLYNNIVESEHKSEQGATSNTIKKIF